MRKFLLLFIVQFVLCAYRYAELPAPDEYATIVPTHYPLMISCINKWVYEPKLINCRGNITLASSKQTYFKCGPADEVVIINTRTSTTITLDKCEIDDRDRAVLFITVAIAAPAISLLAGALLVLFCICGIYIYYRRADKKSNTRQP